MWRLALVLALCVPLPIAGCALTPPVEYADRTIADERTAVALELSYATASRAGTALARAGIIASDKWRELDGKAYSALLAVRSAYQAGNATDYASAVAEMQAAIAEINALLGKVA